MVSVEGLIGAFVFAGFGAVVAWNGWTAYSDEQSAVDNAVEVQATVTDVGVSESEQRVDIEDGGTRMRTRYAPSIKFEYTVEGEAYTAQNIYPPAGGLDAIPRYSRKSDAREEVATYEQGTTTAAYVDPQQPSEGFLERETNTLRNLAAVIFGGLFIAGGAVFFIVSLVLF